MPPRRGLITRSKEYFPRRGAFKVVVALAWKRSLNQTIHHAEPFGDDHRYDQRPARFVDNSRTRCAPSSLDAPPAASTLLPASTLTNNQYSEACPRQGTSSCHGHTAHDFRCYTAPLTIPPPGIASDELAGHRRDTRTAQHAPSRACLVLVMNYVDCHL